MSSIMPACGQHCARFSRNRRDGDANLIEPNAAQAAIRALDLNATKAAVRAGYSAKTARIVAAQNLSKLNISSAIAKAQNKRAERCEPTLMSGREGLTAAGSALAGASADFERVQARAHRGDGDASSIYDIIAVFACPRPIAGPENGCPLC